MRSFIAFIKKETFHILRDTRTLYILFGMPIALVLIFGYTVTNEFKNASVAVYDKSNDPLSGQLIRHLTSSGHFRLIKAVRSVEELEDLFMTGDVKLGIMIPAHFEKNFHDHKVISIQLITDATEPNYAATLTTYASRMIQSFKKKNAVGSMPQFTIDIETRMLYNPTLIGAYNFIPGVVALILMLICAMMTSLTIAREKELGTMDLLLVSPLNPILIILGKVTPYIVLSFINALVVFGMGYLIFEVPIRGSMVLLLALTVLYLLVALALGILISTKSNTQQTAMMSSLFTLLMPTILLSGFIFPIASMPKFLQVISMIIPAKYFIMIEKAIMLKGADWNAVAFYSGILALMVLVLFIAAWRNFKVIYK